MAEETKREGARAYAAKQSAMFHKLATRCDAMRKNLPRVLADDLAKQEAKEAKEQEEARKKTASGSEKDEHLWIVVI